MSGIDPITLEVVTENQYPSSARCELLFSELRDQSRSMKPGLFMRPFRREGTGRGSVGRYRLMSCCLVG